MSQTADMDTVVVRIPAHLYRRIERRAREAEFASAEEYIVFALTEVTGDDSGDEPQPELSAEDEGKLMDRLRGLGYVE